MNITITDDDLGCSINVTITDPGTCSPPEIGDPCSCDDPLNIVDADGNVLFFHDVLTVRGTPGDQVVLTTGGINFLNGAQAQIPNGTVLGTIPASGEFNFDFFHASGASGSIILTIGGVEQPPFAIDVCNAEDCATSIPTMSEWGLIIFGLLTLNLGLIFLRRKESILA